MMTQHDVDVFEQTGNITPDRLRAAQHALRQNSNDARSAAHIGEHYDGMDPRAAAALRGKATAYVEASNMLESLLHGNPLPVPQRVIRDRGARLRARKRAEAER